jgi:hypothetical protein
MMALCGSTELDEKLRGCFALASGKGEVGRLFGRGNAKPLGRLHIGQRTGRSKQPLLIFKEHILRVPSQFMCLKNEANPTFRTRSSKSPSCFSVDQSAGQRGLRMPSSGYLKAWCKGLR